MSSSPTGIDPLHIPPVLVNLGIACHYCLKEKTAQNPLLQCACRHVWYCNTECRKAEWPSHTYLCDVYQTAEDECGRKLLDAYWSIPKDRDTLAVTNIGVLEEFISDTERVITKTLEDLLGRPLVFQERHVVGWEPHCLACGRTDALFRIEAELAKRNTRPAVLKPCPYCNLSFYCCESHWRTAKSKHENEPSPYSRDNLTQCGMNKRCLEDLRCSQIISAGSAVGEFTWRPERIFASWSSVRDIDWANYEYGLYQAFKSYNSMGKRFMDAMLRAASENLSMPLTILWGLEVLNGDDDTWTKKDVLDIHADELEISSVEVFEEIVHRLPLVKTLMLTFIGPNLDKFTGPEPLFTELKTCSDCVHSERSIAFNSYPTTYHQYMDDRDSTKPDLAIAFNSGCSKSDIEYWKTTYRALFRKRVPSLFTASNEAEAQRESVLFHRSGINFHPELRPRHNPWGSLISKLDPKTISRFSENNGWISGGWR
ncbi:hypothetical protein CPB84DRAFT_1687229 [Gymnopilus junonius]|uniref:MYND-type domain-containing protein n=1 Tax=Gymnopilus junonius TaxID=109634 RepID=A0A9P5TJ56_GYMJU|nr:hypothetical protein CPB84DRAFT_1687229 [Gymnopilus junonius]